MERTLRTILLLPVFLHYTLYIYGQHHPDTSLPYPKRETRAVWLTTLSGLDWPRTRAKDQPSRQRQQDELRLTLDELKDCGINTVIMQVRVRGGVIYPSAIEPWDEALTGTPGQDPGYDPLAMAVEEAHRRGMELHAWVVAVPAFKTTATGRTGSKSLLSTHPELLRIHQGMYYLDPGEPATATYLASICRELTERYDIDGIHLDYIRYPERAQDFPDRATYRKYGNGQDKAQWRRNNITRIVREVYRTVKDAKPWVKLSCSPVGKYSDLRRHSSRGWNARDIVYQDAQGWLADGIMDDIYPMMYFTGDNFYPFAADWRENDHGRHATPGLAVYMLSPQEKDWSLHEFTAQLNHTRSLGLTGQCLFRTSFLLGNTKGIRDYLTGTFYAYPALTPAYPWLDSEPPTQPSAPLCTDISTQLTCLSWHPSTDNMTDGGVRYNIYASHSYPVDTDDARNLMATSLTDTTFTYNRTLGLHLAITATDRCGNESQPLQLPAPWPQTATQSLPHDGHTLPLPLCPDATEYRITTPLGNTAAQGDWGDHADIASLSPGLYILQTITAHATPRTIARFAK